MAEVAALELRIGAKMDQAVRGLARFEKSLEQLKGDLKTFKIAQETTFDPKQFADYQRKINQITGEIDRRFGHIGTSAKQASRAMTQMNKSSSSAANSLFALSGAVQDAPYGIRGVANNITFLSQQLAYTTKEAGGFKNALKAMGKSFIGPAGIIFGVSAATSLLEIFANRTSNAAKETEELKDEITTLGEGLGSAIGNTKKESVQLDLLYEAATNAAGGIDLQREAAEKLKQLKPKLFKQYSTEQIMVGDAAKAYNLYTKQVLKAARAQGAFNAIVENSKKRSDLFGQVLDLSNELSEATAANKSQIANFNAIFERLMPDSSISALGARIAVINEFLRQPSKVNEAISKGLISKSDVNTIIGLSDALGALGDQERKINAEISKRVKKYTKLGQVSEKIKSTINVSDFVGGLKTPGQKTVIEKANEEVDKLNKKLPVLSTHLRQLQQVSIGKGGNAADVYGRNTMPGLAGGAVQTLNIDTSKIQAAQEALNALMDEAIGKARTLQGAFEGVFTAIVNGRDPLRVLADMAKQMAIQFAAAAAAAKVISSISGQSFQGVLGGMGSGGALLGILGKLVGIPFFANGGFVNRPTLAVVGDDNTGGEWILNQNQMSALLNSRQQTVRITGEFIQRGSDLVAVIDNQNLINENT